MAKEPEKEEVNGNAAEEKVSEEERVGGEAEESKAKAVGPNSLFANGSLSITPAGGANPAPPLKSYRPAKKSHPPPESGAVSVKEASTPPPKRAPQLTPRIGPRSIEHSRNNMTSDADATQIVVITPEGLERTITINEPPHKLNIPKIIEQSQIVRVVPKAPSYVSHMALHSDLHFPLLCRQVGLNDTLEAILTDEIVDNVDMEDFAKIKNFIYHIKEELLA